MSSYILILTFHKDPGHGWIEIPAVLMDRLNILESISKYSYYSHDRQAYFLEEDRDAEILSRALQSQNIKYVLQSVNYNSNAFIRRLSRVGAA